MAYTKQTWAKGDIITAAKLNHMEQGIQIVSDASVPEFEFSIIFTGDGNYTSSISFNDVNDMIDDGNDGYWKITIQNTKTGSSNDVYCSADNSMPDRIMFYPVGNFIFSNASFDEDSGEISVEVNYYMLTGTNTVTGFSKTFVMASA